MNTDDLMVVNKKTGEEVPGKMLFVPAKCKCGDFVMLFQERLPEIATNTDLKGADFRLLLVLMHFTAFENDIRITPTLLAKELNTATSNVYASLYRLRDANIIEKDETLQMWKFTLTFLWRGKVRTLNNAKTQKLRAQSARNRAEERAA